MNKRWSSKRIAISLLVVVVIVMGSILWLLPHTPKSLQPATLKFSARECKVIEAAPTPEQDKLRDIHRTWMNENTLLIQTHVPIPCTLKIINGNYKTEGATLILEYGISAGPGPACRCFNEITYEITDLKRADYDIKLIQK